MTYIINLVVFAVCAQFAFSADNADTGGKESYISFEDAQAALPGKEIYKPQEPVFTRSAPDWDVNASLYEFNAVLITLIEDNGEAISEPGDVLAAFDADGNVRGVSTEQDGFGPTAGLILHEVIIFGNVAGDEISFQYYDASADEVLSSGASYSFVINDLLGDAFEPYELSVGTVTLSIDLAAGWNMFSVNVVGDDMSTSTVLASLNPSFGDQIKNPGGSAVFYGFEYGWVGSLQEISVTSMYMIKLSNTDVFDFTGTPVDPSTTPIALGEGWNSIGYLPQGTLAVNDALATVFGTFGDQIKNASGSAVFYGFDYGWVGSLATMSPGEGFMIKVAVASNLVYPNADGMARMSLSLEEAKVLPAAISSWDVNPHAYEFSGTIDLSIDNREDYEGDYIGVFVGDECRGIADRMYFPIDGSYYYSVMVFSNVTEGEKLSFRYYSSLDDEIIEFAETEEFIANMNDWNGLNTFSLSREVHPAPEEYSLSDAYPNPFNPTTTLSFSVPTEGPVSLNIYDMTGRLVSTLVDGNLKEGYHSITWDGKDSNGYAVSSGMYIYSLKGEGISITKKMVMMK